MRGMVELRQEDLAPVSAQQLKDAWPTYLSQINQAQRPAGFQPLNFSLTLRSGILHIMVGENVTPTTYSLKSWRTFQLMGLYRKKKYGSG